jgi:hypothetical protein
MDEGLKRVHPKVYFVIPDLNVVEPMHDLPACIHPARIWPLEFRFASKRGPQRILMFSFAFATLFLGFASWMIYHITKLASHHVTSVPYVPPVKFDTLPAEEVLVRGAQEPTQEQSAVLLRAAEESADTPAEQLLRAAESEIDKG